MHLFEFTDQPWLPRSARTTFFEILDLCNSRFRSYNESVASRALKLANKLGATRIVELGAGTAPITQHLAANEDSEGLELVPCDINPPRKLYRQLATEHPEKVQPVYKPVDFSKPLPWHEDTLLLFCACLHHLPSRERARILATLATSDSHVVVFEPMKKSSFSIVSVLFSIFPALLLPLMEWRSRGFLRRAFWCWILPIVPMMFVWDAVVSCLRQWPDERWRRELSGLFTASRPFHVESGWHSQTVFW